MPPIHRFNARNRLFMILIHHLDFINPRIQAPLLPPLNYHLSNGLGCSPTLARLRDRQIIHPTHQAYDSRARDKSDDQGRFRPAHKPAATGPQGTPMRFALAVIPPEFARNAQGATSGGLGQALIASPQMHERVAVAAHDRRAGTVCEGDLPRIILTEPTSCPPGPPLQFGTFPGMLEADALGDVMAQEFHGDIGIVAAFQKLRHRHAAQQEGALGHVAILPQPGRCRARTTRGDLAFELDQKRRIKQHGRHGEPSWQRSSRVRPQPSRPARGWSRSSRAIGHGSAPPGTSCIVSPSHRAAGVPPPCIGWIWGIPSRCICYSPTTPVVNYTRSARVPNRTARRLVLHPSPANPTRPLSPVRGQARTRAAPATCR